MEKSYNPQAFEKEVYSRMEEGGFFRPENAPVDKGPDPSEAGKPFLITMPPPNVTGALHQGHALFVSIEDAYARWKRMRGYRSLWLPGTDHAGIATQLMVERMLEKEGTSRLKVGREEFLRRTWEWKEKHGGIITEQMRSLGASCDWSRERFTMDEESNRAVRASFLRFFHEGLIYRAERLVNWSTGLQTAVSDLEVESKPVEGTLYHIRYPYADGSGELIVATTRPETMFADVAVAVNPNDGRYAQARGKKIRLPLTTREIPIIEDEYVDVKFGTGALKITPGHDHNDFLIGQKHKLPILSVIDRSGKLNILAGDFAGLDVKAARKAAAMKLEELGLLVKKEKHNHEVGHCQRSGVVIEPLISMQWWMKMRTLADNALEAARPKREGAEHTLRFYPDFWSKTYFEWLENIQDWCISRQLWWGHQIPAWHCNDCHKITVPKSIEEKDPSACAHCGSKKLKQDDDVLDTWYSSGLWPISTLGWPDENAADLKFYYPKTRYDSARAKETRPLALMETGSDILFFWVARMLMMCTHLMDGRLPFEDVYLHSIVRDSKGQKMSKTKGNVVDPLDIISEHGADSLRLTLLALSGGGRSVNFDLKRLEGYKGFLNKLWNACRFTLPQLEGVDDKSFQEPISRAEFLSLPADAQWILHRLSETAVEVNRQLDQYRFDLAFSAIYQFVWYEFCDWYLELAKLQDKENPLLKRVLHTSATQILKLLHPLAPFVTEEIYSHFPARDAEMLMVSGFPGENSAWTAPEASLVEVAALRAAVDGLRNFRTENQISPRDGIQVFLSGPRPLWEKIAPLVSALARIEKAEFLANPLTGPAGKVVAGDFEFQIPLAGLVDSSAEASRLESEVKKLREDIGFVEKRLANPNFVDKAKPELVDKERARLTEFQEKIKSLETSLAKLKD
jgi:valyl-tRNA synthetase